MYYVLCVAHSHRVNITNASNAISTHNFSVNGEWHVYGTAAECARSPLGGPHGPHGLVGTVLHGTQLRPSGASRTWIPTGNAATRTSSSDFTSSDATSSTS